MDPVMDRFSPTPIIKGLPEQDTDNIQQYFAPSVWNSMGDYEKRSYRNIVQNYNVMHDLGLNPKKPYFMESSPQLGTKGKSYSRETCPSQPKHRRLLSRDELPHTIVSSMIKDEDELFANLNFDLFSPEEKKRGIRLHNMFSAALNVYKKYRRHGRVAWVPKMYRLPGKVVRRVVPVGLKPTDMEPRNKEPDVEQRDKDPDVEPGNRDPDVEPGDKEPDVEPGDKKPDVEPGDREPDVVVNRDKESNESETESDAERRREHAKLKRVFRIVHNKKQFRTVQTQTLVSAELSLEEIEIWASLVFKHRDDKDPTPAQPSTPAARRPMDPEDRRKMLQRIEEFKRTNWKTVETQTELTGELDLYEDIELFAWLFEIEEETEFCSQSNTDVTEAPDKANPETKLKTENTAEIDDNEGDEFNFASEPETDSPEVCKSVTVTDKEETTVKTYENEGDEFEFPSWNELDCADDDKDTTQAKSKLEEEFDTFDFGDSQETKNVEPVKKPLLQTQDAEIHNFAFTPELQKDAKDTTQAKSKLEEEFDTFDLGDSQETKNVEPVKKPLLQTQDDEIHDFAFTQELQKDYKATKQVTQDKMDFSDFDFGYSPETLKKLKGTKDESTTPKFSQEMGKVKPYHSTKSSDETVDCEKSDQETQNEIDSDFDFGFTQEEADEAKSKKAEGKEQREEIPPQDPSTSTTETRVSRYPKRNTAKVDYKEEEDLQDDDYIFCDLCDHEHLGDCPEHGPLKHFVDTYDQLRLGLITVLCPDRWI